MAVMALGNFRETMIGSSGMVLPSVVAAPRQARSMFLAIIFTVLVLVLLRWGFGGGGGGKTGLSVYVG